MVWSTSGEGTPIEEESEMVTVGGVAGALSGEFSTRQPHTHCASRISASLKGSNMRVFPNEVPWVVTAGSMDGGEAADVEPLTTAGAVVPNAGSLILWAQAVSVTGKPWERGDAAIEANFAKTISMRLYCSSYCEIALVKSVLVASNFVATNCSRRRSAQRSETIGIEQCNFKDERSGEFGMGTINCSKRVRPALWRSKSTGTT